MRTYSQDQVAAIIERAVERQHAAEQGSVTDGLTLEEIERLGRESGIDPAHLRAAAEEVDEAGHTLARQTGQTKTQVYVERWVDAPFTAAGWEDAVAHLRASHGANAGAAFASPAGETVEQVGDAVEWTHTSPLGVRTRVTVSPRGNRTRLRMTQLVGLASPTAEGVAYGGLIAVFVALAALAVASGLTDGVLAPGLTAMTAFLVAWAVGAPLVSVADRRWRARKLRDLDALADALVPILNGPAERAGDRTDGARAPRLDLDALADAPATTPARRDRPRTRG